MTITKSGVLTGAATLVVTATVIGVITALVGRDSELVIRLTSAAGVLGLGSIGMFFVGLAYPRQAGVTDGNTKTTKA